MHELECAICDYKAPTRYPQDGQFFCSNECWIEYLETLVPESS